MDNNKEPMKDLVEKTNRLVEAYTSLENEAKKMKEETNGLKFVHQE